jgi:hypothetical protein
MKKTRIIYWIFTALFAFFMLGSAIPDALVMPIAIGGFKEMGYPVYLIPFLGIAKILGVIAILIPGYPRIKEWAYAGLTFDLLGATYSIICIGKSIENWAPMFIILFVAAGSYIYYHKKLKVTALDQPDNDSAREYSVI